MIIVDTGPLVAMLHAGDRAHERCLRWYDNVPGPLIVPQTVAVEVRLNVTDIATLDVRHFAAARPAPRRGTGQTWR